MSTGWNAIQKRQKTLSECGVHLAPGQHPVADVPLPRPSGWAAVMGKRQTVIGSATERPLYVTVPTPLLPPAKVHTGLEVVLNKGPLWSVAVADLRAGDVAAHCRALTCTPNKDKPVGAYGAPTPFYIGFVKEECLWMPPSYAAAAFPNALPGVDGLSKGEAMRDEAVFTGSLWADYPPQQQAVSAWAAWQAANNNMPCMLSLPCGHGKSVICLAIAATQVRRVTLIIMHMKGLVDQWIEEAKKYVPGAKVGYVKSKCQRVKGVDFIIASVQSLHKHIQAGKPYLVDLFQRVGFVILDEAHHGVANTFQQVIANMPAARRLAVTATPRRQDGLFKELQFIFGPIVFRSYRKKGDCQVVMLKYTNPALTERRVRGTVAKYLMERDLLKDRVRTQMGLELAVDLVITQGRRVLLLTSQVTHVQELAEKAEVLLKAGWAAASTDPPPLRKVRLFVEDPTPRKRVRRKGETPEEAARLAEEAQFQYEDSGPHGHWEEFDAPEVATITTDHERFQRLLNYEARVVVATYDIMKEGISYNDWDTLLDMDDGMDPEQMVGRIQRMGNKKVPLVIDVYTPLSLYYGMMEHRVKEFYLQEEYDMHYQTASHDGTKPPAAFWQQFNRKAVNVL
jgi:hypothetical protein